ncbi:MAG: glycoside hydrolase family 105 protein [Granulosicoccus sp.]
MLIEFSDAYAKSYQPYKGGRWCYEDGCIYRGLELLHIETGEQRWLDHLYRLCDPQINPDGGLKGYVLSDYNIDNVLPGRGLLYLYEQTGEPRFMLAADLLVRQLSTHPRTQSGVYWHKLRYPWQIWLDGLYMGQPFRIAHALIHGHSETVADSLAQIDVALATTFDPTAGLYKHAYDEAREQSWADKSTGLSPAFWARAIGWLAMALVDVADLVGNDFSPLRMRTIALLNKLQELRESDGLWLQVIDRPELKGNYTESSTSAMFTYAFLRAARLGLIEPPANLVETLTLQCLKSDKNGGSEMIEICEVAGLGMYENRYRDGSAEYYVSEQRVSNDAKGVGPLMMVAAIAND